MTKTADSGAGVLMPADHTWDNVRGRRRTSEYITINTRISLK